ncbi:MAG: hypothetical protein HWE25_03235 [Alphaproteobacteria bacterium]|nr:hypothetical protein [Alphaproteobacteria bacterium]
MATGTENWAERFIRDMRRWSWPNLLRDLQATDLLVIDADLLKVIVKEFGALACKTTGASDAANTIDSDVNRVFVFLGKGEWQLVKQLRAGFPDMAVYSLTYDLAPRSILESPKLTGEPRPGMPVDRPPVLLLSTPYSDAEYLAEILRRNGFADPREYLDRSLATLLERHDRFQVIRYFAEAERWGRRAGVFDLHLQADVLSMVFAKSRADWGTLAEWIKAAGAQVIYFSRRDKIAQTGVGAVLGGSVFRSVFETNAEQRKALTPDIHSFADTHHQLQSTLLQEAELEEFLTEEVEDFRSVTLEELVEQPVAVMRGITMFLGRQMPRSFQMPDYRQPYLDMPEVLQEAANFRRQLIDRLGLHVNAAGSFVSQTDAMLKR